MRTTLKRFDFEQYDGQIYITEDGEQVLHALIRGPDDVTVQVGIGCQIEIDKLYGPLVFQPIRVSLDFDSCEWVIERNSEEWCRIPGQLDED